MVPDRYRYRYRCRCAGLGLLEVLRDDEDGVVLGRRIWPTMVAGIFIAVPLAALFGLPSLASVLVFGGEDWVVALIAGACGLGIIYAWVLCWWRRAELVVARPSGVLYYRTWTPVSESRREHLVAEARTITLAHGHHEAAVAIILSCGDAIALGRGCPACARILADRVSCAIGVSVENTR